jgi:Mg/Co/Ni transporter MgtE
MSTITQEPASAAPERRHRSVQILVREMWASLSIAAMWLAVLFAAVFAPDFVSSDAGGNTTRIPSAIAIALFAAIGTRAVAKYGFGRLDEDGEEPGP